MFFWNIKLKVSKRGCCVRIVASTSGTKGVFDKLNFCYEINYKIHKENRANILILNIWTVSNHNQCIHMLRVMFKGTVGVILSDLPFKRGHTRFKTKRVPFFNSLRL